MHARPVPEETLAALKRTLTAACSNSVRHAYAENGGRVQIVYELLPDRVVIEVADEGTGFDAAETHARDELTEGGLWIAIIRSVADEFEIKPGEGGRGSRLRFVKLLHE